MKKVQVRPETKTLQDRFRYLSQQFAYRRLVEIVKSFKKEDGVDELKRVYTMFADMFFDEVHEDLKISVNPKINSGEIRFSNEEAIEEFAQRNIEEILRIADEYLPVFVHLFREVVKANKARVAQEALQR